VVQAKAQAAVKWCRAASQHAAGCGGKPWSYLLIPDGRNTGAATLQGLTAACILI
jgi:type III restriction enzyme